MPFRGIALCLAMILVLAGCSDHSLPEVGYEGAWQDQYDSTQDSVAEVAAADDGYLYLANGSHGEAYRLDSGDKIRVDVFGQENLSRTYSVDGGGFVSLPLIGAVQARGQTTFSLERTIASRLSQRYLRNPKVTVEISAYRPFFILGEVRNPGKFPYENGMTVQTAVAIAGGYTPRASEEFVNLTRKVGGRPVTREVPFNFPVKPGDTIYVEERFL